MRNSKALSGIGIILLLLTGIAYTTCSRLFVVENEWMEALKAKGLKPEIISAEAFFLGIAPAGFEEIAGASYKPSFNEEPAIPAQCWIETGYGTQNACKYCHTNYLAEIGHGNNFPIADDQILYSFPTPALNRILWQNIIHPGNIDKRLKAEGILVPNLDDVDYVRYDNWLPAFMKGRKGGNDEWLNHDDPDNRYALFPSLDPRHLFPFNKDNPTSNGLHGFVDPNGFVRDEQKGYTGWRAVNFFPYGIFTPLTGSVSGIYIRLPMEFRMQNGVFNAEVYSKNLDLLEKNVKNRSFDEKQYFGDASNLNVNKGFYPVGTEFAHPLHYVDLFADGEFGVNPDGLIAKNIIDYEFPGTRSKRIKEMRYMYKWKEVDLEEIALEEDSIPDSADSEFELFIGREGQGWVDNGAGWILAAFIENRQGELRPQTTEELTQCIGCHAKVGNTVDAVWSFQRKLPGNLGWGEMNYGQYDSKNPGQTKLNDYVGGDGNMGEMAAFYYSVSGGDLYGVMPDELRHELIGFFGKLDEKQKSAFIFPVSEILDDEILKNMNRGEREPRLIERQKLMRYYSSSFGYLDYNASYIKGSVFYPFESTMKANIQAYRKVVLDQSFNLGKDVFGSEPDHIPFTFRSDGSIRDEFNKLIPVGDVIYSRPYNKMGIGYLPTGIITGKPLDKQGNEVEEGSPNVFARTGTLDMYYNPILSDSIYVKGMVK
jgi:hypothetical protein